MVAGVTTIAPLSTLVLAVAYGLSHQPRPIDNPTPTPAAPAYRLSAAPTIKVGGLNSDPRLEIVSFRAVAITRNGSLAVAPAVRGNATAIRIFAPGGRFVREIGRAGDGPGEFRSVTSITALGGDSLLVHDRTLARLTIFDGQGAVVTTRDNAGGDRCCVAGNSYLIANTSLEPAVDPGRVPPRDSLRIDIRTVGSVTSRKVLTLPGYERPVCIGTMSNDRCGGAGGLMRPFVSQPQVIPAGDVFIYASGERYEYRVYDAEGELLRTVRAAVPPRPVTAADIDSAKTHILAGFAGDARRVAEAAWSRMTLPRMHLAYRRALTETDGSVWLLGCGPSDNGRCWAKFDPAGRLQGTLLIPPDWEVASFANGHAILWRADESTQTRLIEVRAVERARAP
jgi:hypothetical protein